MATVSTNDNLVTNIGAAQVTEPTDPGVVSGAASSAAAYGYPPDVIAPGIPSATNPAGTYT